MKLINSKKNGFLVLSEYSDENISDYDSVCAFVSKISHNPEFDIKTISFRKGDLTANGNRPNSIITGKVSPEQVVRKSKNSGATKISIAFSYRGKTVSIITDLSSYHILLSLYNNDANIREEIVSLIA